jgi:hypothetical protein
MSKFEIAYQYKFPSFEDEHCTALYLNIQYPVDSVFCFLDVVFWVLNGKYPLEFD